MQIVETTTSSPNSTNAVLAEVALTDIQLNIVELMKNNPLKKYGRVCYVDDKKFNANSVKSLIEKGVIQFYVHDGANGWDYYELSDHFR